MDFGLDLVRRAAAEQGGVLSGANPAHYDKTNPIRVWVIQLIVIISTVQILSLLMSRIRQPRVIAEVIGGIILGPTVMGRIPGFKQAIFPDDSMPSLALVANVGLVLFLFLVGLEVDTRLIKRNLRVSSIISIAGLIIPLGLGAALGVAVYKEFVDPAVNFGYFILFVAVAIGITAFPVLCRILTECKLLETTVGVIVLSAGVGNDVVGWVLLALAVALANASQPLTALYVLLTCVGYVIFLLYPGRWAYRWLAKRTGSLEQGSPTPFMMTVTMITVFASAFFTDIIGVHAIFGGFLAGLIIPHDNGFAISIVEKLEDLVTILLLPLYFTLSGLRTDIGAMNTGKVWGYTVLICLVAFVSKFGACGASAKMLGFNWREAGAIGSLMSCKGLVELIVLNIGLQAGILNKLTFAMFVVHAIVLTFITTPLTLLFYPARHRVRDGLGGSEGAIEGGATKGHKSIDEDDIRTKFAIVMDRMEQLPAAMTLSQLLQQNPTTVPPPDYEKTSTTSPGSALSSTISIDAIRLIELTDRTSAVFRSQEAEILLHNDPLISIYRTYGHLNNLAVSATLSVVSYDDFPTAIASHVQTSDTQMVIIPWARGVTSVVDADTSTQIGGARNPFDGVFHKTTTEDQTSSIVYSEYIRKVFANTPSDVALFVDRGGNAHYTGNSTQHLVLPFFGGPDDRLALNFLVQICARTSVSATVVKIQREGEAGTANEKTRDGHLTVAAADTVYGSATPETRLASDTADNIIWDRYTRKSDEHSPSVVSALSRITFSVKQSERPLHSVVELVQNEVANGVGKNLVVLAGRSRRMAVQSHEAELRKFISEKESQIGSSVPRTLGDVGAVLVAAGSTASMLIVQAAI